MVERHLPKVNVASSNLVSRSTSQQTTLHSKIPAFAGIFSYASLLLLFRKKARSARLLGCKRPHNDSLSLPPFCELRLRRNVSFLVGFSISEQAWLVPFFLLKSHALCLCLYFYLYNPKYLISGNGCYICDISKSNHIDLKLFSSVIINTMAFFDILSRFLFFGYRIL